MIFLDRAPPAGTTYARSDLAGTWQVFSLQGAMDDSADGTWLRGTLTFDATGTLLDARLVDAAGVALPAMSAGAFEVDAQGLVAGAAEFAPGGELDVTAAMLAGKTQIIGVSRIDAGDGVSPSTLGLFTLIKQPGEAPPASQVKFSAASYKTTEGAAGDDHGEPDRRQEHGGEGGLRRAHGRRRSARLGHADVRRRPGLAHLHLHPGAEQPGRGRSDGTAHAEQSDQRRHARESLDGVARGRRRRVADRIHGRSLHGKENASSATITLRRTGGLGSPSTVQVSATAGTAVPGRDFTPVSQHVTFSPNATTKTFKVPLIDNKLLDGNRTVMLTVSLAPPSGGAPPVIGSRSTATLTILDNDQPGVITLSAGSYSAKEGSTVTITVKRQASGSGPLGGNVSVDYIVSSNGSAVAGLDYTVATGLTGTLTFVGTETSLKVPIQLLDDTLAEGQEYFLFSLAKPTNGATLGAPSTATVYINDNDDGGKLMLSASTFSVSEGAGNLSVTIKRSAGKASNVSVPFTTGGGTAVPGTDYTSVSAAVEFGFNEMTRTVVDARQSFLRRGDDPGRRGGHPVRPAAVHRHGGHAGNRHPDSHGPADDPGHGVPQHLRDLGGSGRGLHRPAVANAHLRPQRLQAVVPDHHGQQHAPGRQP